MHWYYSKDGAQHGPIAQEELQGKIRNGEVARDALIWREGMADWTPASQLSEFASAAPMGGAAPIIGAAPYSAPASQMGGAYQAPVPTYLWQAIVVTLLCCMPFGIPAIVFASKVETLRSRGDIAGAIEASGKAKMWCWLGFGVGFGFIALYLIFVFVAASSGSF